MAIRGKMSRENRAKQFMPFAALKGYEAALREKEKIVVPRAMLSEDMQEELNRKLYSLKPNDMVTVTYYRNGEYIRVTGMISKLDMSAGYVKIVNTRIMLVDIYQID